MADGTNGGGGRDGGAVVIDVRNGLCRIERVPETVPVPVPLVLVLLVLLAILGPVEGEAELEPGK